MTGHTSSARALELQGRIRAGLGRLNVDFRRRHRRFVASARASGGGFAGRGGRPDRYYTHFGLRAADALELDRGHELWTAAADFMEGLGRPPGDVVDCYCEAFSRALLAQRDCCSANWESLPEVAAVCRGEATGGEGSSEGTGEAGSLYRAFLAAMTLELLGERPSAEDVGRFVMERRCVDGGFSDTRGAERGSLNPTAAAVVLLCSVGKREQAAEAGGFLAGLQRPDGGFPAHSEAPSSDLMSTFTALVALEDVGRLDGAEMGAAARFARELEAGSGGFYGAPQDREVDVEYTYYGLGVVGLLSYRARVAGEDAE